MSKSSLLLKKFSNLDVHSITCTHKMSITQGTSLTSGVTLHSPVGSINTIPTNLSMNSTLMFTCANAYVTVNNSVFANIIDYSGTSGIPMITVDNITRGSFIINVTNDSSINELNGVVRIGFLVL